MRGRGDDFTSPDRPRWIPRTLGGAVLSALVLSLSIAVFGPDGRTSGDWVLGMGVAIACGLLIATVRSPWSRPGAWAALVVVGQAATLSWIDAGPGVHYPHLTLDPSRLDVGLWLAPAIVFLQLAALTLAGHAVGPALLRFVRSTGSTVRWTAVALMTWSTSAALSRDPLFFLIEATSVTALQFLALACCVAAGLSLTADQAAHLKATLIRVLESPRLPWCVALWIGLACAGLMWLAYEAHPHVPDEVVYLLHARTFAAGRLDVPLPPVPAAFEIDLVSYDLARWFVPVPPGWPAALAIGVALGIPWLVNPLLGAASVLLVFALIRQIYGRRVAGGVVVFMATSPWFLFLNMSLMTHAFTLFAAAVAAVAIGRRIRGGAWSWAVLAGVALGAVALNRPLEGLVAAAGLALWALWSRTGGRSSLPSRVGDVATMAVFSAAVVAATFPYNEHFTGDPLTFPIMAYADEIYGEGSNDLGFGPDKGLGFGGLDPFPGHGLPDVIVNSQLNLSQINVELSGWSVGSSALIAMLLLVLGGFVAADWAMVGSIALVIAAHSLYWFSGGPDFGARYWYLSFLPLAVLAVRAVQELCAKRPESGRVVFGVAILTVSALLVFVPWRATDKYWHYRGMDPGIRALAAEHDWDEDDLILVRGDRHPDYASAAVYNPLDVRTGGPLYAWDRGPRVRAALSSAYPDWTVWIVEGPTLTGGGYAVLSGPQPSALP